MPHSSALDRLPRYVYAVAAALVLLVAAFAAFVLNQSNFTREFEQQLRLYHLATISNLDAIRIDLQMIENDTVKLEQSTALPSAAGGDESSHEHSADVQTPAGTAALRNDVFFAHIFVIRSEMQEIRETQNDFAVPLFASPVQRLEERFAAVEKILMTTSDPPAVIDRGALAAAIEAYGQTLEQLRRLHLREVEHISGQLAVDYAEGQWRTVWIGLLCVLALVLIVARIAYLVKASVATEKDMRRELRLHRDHLEAMVAQRTKDLTNANKELESYNHSLAHDMRTPLRAIIGFSQILLSEAPARLLDEEKGHLNRIVAAGKHIATMIDDILDLAKVSRGDLQMASIDLSAAANEIVGQLRAAEPQRQVTVAVQDGLKTVGAPTLINLVLNNLLSNAWKFSRHSPAAKIEFGSEQDKGRKVFFVRDNGAGFDMQYVDKIFVPFQRLHGNSEYEGSGIGLAIVQRVIHRHYGQVWIESELGRGTTVYFSLPEHETDQAQPVVDDSPQRLAG